MVLDELSTKLLVALLGDASGADADKRDAALDLLVSSVRSGVIRDADLDDACYKSLFKMVHCRWDAGQ